MARIEIPLANSHTDVSSRVNRERLINCFWEVDIQGKMRRIRRAQGLSLLRTIGTGVIRAMEVVKDKMYVVSGTEVYECGIAPSGNLTPTLINSGTPLNTETTPVSIAAIGADDPQIVFVDGENAFGYVTATSTFSSLTAAMAAANANFVPLKTCTSLNQRVYFESNGSGGDGTNVMFACDVLDITGYTATSFVSAESNPDVLRAVHSYKTQMYLYGANSVERWQTNPAEGTLIPLRVIQGGNIDRGILAPYSVQQIEDMLIWLADDRSVRVANNQADEKISNLAFEQEVRTFDDVTEAISFVVDTPEHKIYYITFPKSQVTWGYDFNTGTWHKRQSLDEGRWRVNAAVAFDGVVYCGDFENSNIYTLEDEIYQENGADIYMEMISPAINDPRDVFIDCVEVIAEMGIGDLGTDAGDGQVDNLGLKAYLDFAFTKDGGYNWTQRNPISIGRYGEHSNRAIARRFGRLKHNADFMFRLSTTANTQVYLYRVFADIEIGQ